MFTRNDLGAGWQNSSSAHLALPAGSTVVRAWLTWSAVGAGAASTQSADLAAPGGQPVSLKTDQVVPIKVSDQSGYVAVADVTDAVAAGGSGDWTAGNITLADKPGNQLYAGWSLVVVTTSPTAPVQNITVLAGPHLLSSGTDWTGHALGLRGGAADLLMVAWEGDAGHTGDSLSVHGQALSPRDGMSDKDDAAASSSLGALTRDGTAQELTFGVDVRTFEAPRDAADQHGDITLGTNGDNYVLGLLAITTGDGVGGP